MSDKKYTSVKVFTKTGAESKARGVSASEETVVIGGKAFHVAPAVSGYVMALSEEKRLKGEKEVHASVLRTFSNQVREYFTEETDQHRKTYRILGNEKNGFQYAVDAVETDKFSYSTDKEDLQNLREALGEDVFKELFEETIEIGIKKAVMNNEKKRKELSMKLIEKFGKDGIIDYFDRTVTWKLKSGLADTKHKLDKKIQGILDQNLKQAADTLKDASEQIA